MALRRCALRRCASVRVSLRFAQGSLFAVQLLTGALLPSSLANAGRSTVQARFPLFNDDHCIIARIFCEVSNTVVGAETRYMHMNMGV